MDYLPGVKVKMSPSFFSQQENWKKKEETNINTQEVKKKKGTITAKKQKTLRQKKGMKINGVEPQFLFPFKNLARGSSVFKKFATEL